MQLKHLRQLLGAAVITQMGMAGAALAQDSPVVIELFTAQGCSSCPPADELLARAAADPKVLALAFHVDYWDYLGWQDQLADPAFTLRQKAYAHAAGEKMIYTPQAIVNGRARMVGSDAQAVMSAVMQEMNLEPQAGVSAQRSGNTVHISGSAPIAFGVPVEVVLVRFLPQIDVDILHGENAGKTITYVNTVTELRLLGEWSGAEALNMSAEISGEDAAAILVQEAEMGGILAAARVK